MLPPDAAGTTPTAPKPKPKPKPDDKKVDNKKGDDNEAVKAKKPGFQQTQIAELKKEFKKYDKNNDGVVKGKELKGKTPNLPDLNGDGKFNWDESLKSLSFKGRDVNEDGKLSGTELKGLDTSKYQVGEDGALDADEFLAGKKAQRSEFRDERRDAAFDKADVNDDGKLTGTELKGIKDADKYGEDGVDKDEFKEVQTEAWRAKRDEKIEKAFDKADKNQDGILSGNEVGDYAGYDGEGEEGKGEISKDEFTTGWKKDRQAQVDEALLNGPKNTAAKQGADAPVEDGAEEDDAEEAAIDVTEPNYSNGSMGTAAATSGARPGR